MADKIHLTVRSIKSIKRSTDNTKPRKNMCYTFCVKRLPNGSYKCRKRAIVFGALATVTIIYFIFISRVTDTEKNESNGGNVSIVLEEDKQTMTNRSFGIDFENDQFLKDGKPFRYISGSFHYFRAMPDTWSRKLRTLRAAGLNAVSTYVEWSLHNPHDGIYKWDGIADLIKFIQLAAEEDLLVLLRPGPYVCAERDMGGLPYWLLSKYPNIKLRTSDQNFTFEVRKWFAELMPRIQPFLYGNGGPIIMVQIENEYGWFDACDRLYTTWLKNETVKYIKEHAVMYTTDSSSLLSCGKIDGVFTTIDFGPASNEEIDSSWAALRKFQPNGPLVNSEFYAGWLTHWKEKNMQKGKPELIESLKHILDANASINLYMFYGGTNFGFTSGANVGGSSHYLADVTSYDYDAPMNEAGDPTKKYYAIRDLISKYVPPPKIEVPEKFPKMGLPSAQLQFSTLLLSDLSRSQLSTKAVDSKTPLTFEALKQNTGFVLYETILPNTNITDCKVTINGLRDRAHVLMNGCVVGRVARQDAFTTLDITLPNEKPVKLEILVENQGRINFIVANDFKGILENVTLNDVELTDWTMIGFPLDDYQRIEKTVNLAYLNKRDFSKDIVANFPESGGELLKGPAIFHGTFNIVGPIADTYLNPSGWEKGVIFINGFNIGRYWPTAGPQISLYVPAEILVDGPNKITMVELYAVPKGLTVTFDAHPTVN